jgi:LysR family transcriptional regulator, nitrogen assimilation regulatory protein
MAVGMGLKMDIAQLKTLIHVAELGSLSRASDRLNIVQPALSRQIRLLEQELGVFLFERHGRGMVITQAGREVLDHATRIMTELEGIRNSVIGDKADYKGTVVIGMTPTVAEIMTVPLVQTVKSLHPDLRLRITSAFSGHLIDWLQRSEIEIAISYNPPPLKSLRISPIMMENLVYVSAAEGQLQASAAAIPFASLADVELVLPSPHHGLRKIVDDCAQRANVTLRTSVEADSFGAMIDLVKGGFGSTVLPLAPIFSLVESGLLHASPLVDPTPTRELVVVYPADRALSPPARFVADTLRRLAADLVERKIWLGEML